MITILVFIIILLALITLLEHDRNKTNKTIDNILNSNSEEIANRISKMLGKRGDNKDVES